MMRLECEKHAVIFHAQMKAEIKFYNQRRPKPAALSFISNTFIIKISDGPGQKERPCRHIKATLSRVKPTWGGLAVARYNTGFIIIEYFS